MYELLRSARSQPERRRDGDRAMEPGDDDDDTGGATWPGVGLAVLATEAVPALLAEAGVSRDEAAVEGADDLLGDTDGVTPLYCLSSRPGNGARGLRRHVTEEGRGMSAADGREGAVAG